VMPLYVYVCPCCGKVVETYIEPKPKPDAREEERDG
jgi:hypothetical protein